MVQELPKKHESDSPENRSFHNELNSANAKEKSLWPCTKADADSQRELLTRYTSLNTSKLPLPELLTGQADKQGQKADDAGKKAKSPAVRTADQLPTPPDRSSNPLDRLANPLDRITNPIARTSDQSALQAADSPKHEKMNNNGSRVLLNGDNTISKLTRADGSSVDIAYENGKQKQIIESNKDGTARTVYEKNPNGLWESSSETKDAKGGWVKDAKPGRDYRNIQIDENGVSTAIDLVGFHHVTTADGKKLPEGANYTFDEKGRIDSISYDPSENRKFKLHYDANDKLDKVEFRDGEGKLQQSRVKTADGEWKVLNKDGSSAGTWKGEMELSADGKFRQQEAKDKAAGIWQVTAPYEKYTEKLSPNGKHISRVYSDRSEQEFDKTADGQERLTKITKGKDSREFRYDADGKLSQIVDNSANGTQTLKTDGMIARIGMAGELSLEKADGSKIIKRADFSTEERDKDGDIQKVISKDGRTRSFDYDSFNGQKVLVKITNTTPGKNGDSAEVWTRTKNADGSISKQFVSTSADGKQKAIGDVQVLYNGDYRFKSSDGKDRVARLRDSSREGDVSGGAAEARERLLSVLDGQLDGRRKERLEGLMKEFEKRSQDAIERQTAAGHDKDRTAEKWEKKVTQTYDQLAQMMEQNPSGAIYNQATRARLIENFMWIAGDTTRGAQDVGNCWEMSGRNLTGMQNNPDAMARLLKEVSLTGTFTSMNGGLKSKDSLDRRGNTDGPKKFTIPKNMLQINRVNAGWTLDKPDDNYWQGGIGIMPSTPVGYIIDNVLGYMGGRSSHGALDGGTWESFNSPGGHTRNGWYYGINELMYMATGEKTAKPVAVSSNNISDSDISRLTDKRLQRQLLESGGALLIGPGHMFAVKLVKNRGQWQIVADNQWGKGGDQVIGTVTDLKNWTVQRTRTRYHQEHDLARQNKPKDNHA